MAVDERRRSELFQAAARALGQEHAVTMFELLPPSGSDLATEQAVGARFDEVDARFDAIDLRFEQMDRRFEQMDRRFEEMDRRFEEMERRFEEIDRRFEQVDGRFEEMERRFEDVDRRFQDVDRRFQDVDRRFDEVEARAQERHEALVAILRSELGTIDARILQARDEAIATSRSELIEAVSGQTRALVVAVVMAVVGIATLALAFSQLL
jgi:chromosome segregation ATPase